MKRSILKYCAMVCKYSPAYRRIDKLISEGKLVKNTFAKGMYEKGN